jgi:hypothetical protein
MTNNDYVNYISEHLGKDSEYTQYLVNCLNDNLDYVGYISETLGDTLDPNRKILRCRKRKLDRIKNKINQV